MRKGVATEPRQPIPARRRHWRRPVAITVVLAAVALWFAPHVLWMPPFRSAALRAWSPELAERIQFDRVSGGWHTPIVLHGVRYREPSFELTAERVDCDRSLAELLLEPDEPGRVHVKSPRLTLWSAVAANGSERDAGDEWATAPIAQDDPHDHTANTPPPAAEQAPPGRAADRPSVLRLHASDGEIWIDGGSGEPTRIARAVDLSLQRAAGSSEVAFQLNARTGDPEATAHLSAHGTLSWPVTTLFESSRRASVEFVGLDLHVVRSFMSLADPEATAERSDGPEPSTRMHGRLSGRIDVLANSRGMGLEARANCELHGFEWSGAPAGTDLAWPVLGWSSSTRMLPDRIELDSVRLSGTGMTLDGRGTIWDWRGHARAEVGGSVELDWSVLNGRLREAVPEDILLKGRARRPWQLVATGPDAVHIRVDAATHIESLSIAGFELGPLELAARWADGSASFDPIECTFQNGTVRVRPAVRVKQGVAVLAVDPGRVLDRVAIDHALSHALLRYIDPLGTIRRDLDGYLSVDIHELEVPLEPGAVRHSAVSGRVVLEDVQIAPEASLRDVLTIAGIDPPERIRTSQTIELSLRDGRVHHSGLALPIADESVTLEGWVDFAQNIHIVVSLPVTERMLGKDKRLYRILRGQRIELPVTGTLERPRVSSDAMAQNIHRLVQTALRDTFGRDDVLRGLFRRPTK